MPPPPPHPNLPSGITLNSANPSVASKKFWQSSMNDHLCNKRQLVYRLMNWIVNGFNNLDEVEDEDFRKLHEAVNPNVPVISTPHLVDQLYDQYQIIHYFVKRYISKRLFTLTTDTWTSAAKQSYIALTAHFINDDWELESICLDCCNFTGTHTAVDYKRKVEEMLVNCDCKWENVLAVGDDKIPH